MIEQPVEEKCYLYPPKEIEWDDDDDEHVLDLAYELYREMNLFLGRFDQ